MFTIPGVVVWLIGVMVAVHAVRHWLLTPLQDGFLLAFGAFIPLRFSAIGEGEIWVLFTSPVTYAFIHGSVPHLALNSVWLAAFGAPLAARIGTARFLGFCAVTAIAAAFTHYALHATSLAPLIGASGAVSGLTAAAARFALRANGGPGGRAFAGWPLGPIETLRHRTSLMFILIWFAINTLGAIPALTPDGVGGIAWEAHIGGFIAGYLLLGFFDRRPAYG